MSALKISPDVEGGAVSTGGGVVVLTVGVVGCTIGVAMNGVVKLPPNGDAINGGAPIFFCAPFAKLLGGFIDFLFAVCSV